MTKPLRQREPPRVPSVGAGHGAWWYGLLGALLGLGSPLGLGFLRLWANHRDAVAAWAAAEWLQVGGIYLYTALGTVTAFAILGYRLGLRLEKVERRSGEIQRRARTDALTGLLTRGALMEEMDLELRRARRYRTPVACLFLDLDGLKGFNDIHGHKAGDMALTAVAQAMAANARGTDILGRFGGDEFVAVMPHTAAAGARAAAERIRRAVASGSLRLGERPVRLSVSVGVHAAWSGTSAEILNAADRALRRAKAEGKDRVVIDEPAR